MAQPKTSIASSAVLMLAVVNQMSGSCQASHHCWCPPRHCLDQSHDHVGDISLLDLHNLVHDHLTHEAEKMGGHHPVAHSLGRHEGPSLHHVPVVHKVTREVMECRTRHVPVIRHRLRTVEEKYLEHVPVTETLTRPVTDTVVEHVPVVEDHHGVGPFGPHPPMGSHHLGPHAPVGGFPIDSHAHMGGCHLAHHDPVLEESFTFPIKNRPAALLDALLREGISGVSPGSSHCSH